MKIQKYLINAYGTRLLILSLDLTLAFFSFLAAVMLRFNFEVPNGIMERAFHTLIFFAVVRLITFKLFRTYSGIIRFTGEEDLKRAVLASLSGTLIMLLVANLAPVRESAWFSELFLSSAVILIDGLLFTILMVMLRVAMRSVNIFIRKEKGEFGRQPVVIFGAGDCGHITKNTVQADTSSNMQVVAFFDDNPNVHGKILQGVKVLPATKEQFQRIVEKHHVKQAIIAIQKIGQHRKQELADLCLEHSVMPMMVPPVEKWLNNHLHVHDIKKLRIEDLLERPPIQLDKNNISDDLKDKVVLVTGAAGSIGSELARQIAKFGPNKLLLVDNAESPLVDIERELLQSFEPDRLAPIVADIRDAEHMRQIFGHYLPNIVFHAAAYKHVPAMERQPHQAVAVNVLGTRNVADLAVRYGAQKFVMVSTDKAVNPTNVMGASKRIAEIYIQALNDAPRNRTTAFVTTRFGNVLGSNGSVVPLFRRQIEAGQPVTVTHPDITRFFMTIPEACQLVLEAGAMGKGGEIFLFDMGKPVKIVDIAEKMIRLYGLRPNVDIPIRFTNLRPGEKLYEELLSDSENSLPTHHQKITIAKVRQEYSYLEAQEHLNWLGKLAHQDNDIALVEAMKNIVPEFRSKCSKYEALDKIKNPTTAY